MALHVVPSATAVFSPAGPSPLSPSPVPLKPSPIDPALAIDPSAAPADALSEFPPERLQPAKVRYDIAAWSSHSAAYHPRNILVSLPQDQASRWSSASNNQMQFVTLKLARPAVVQSITFGKYHKPHVCNLKEFKVFGGARESALVELLHAGLRNDAEPETFPLRHRAGGVVFPVQFIKVVPLVAHGPNFNFSIWHVELRGLTDAHVVERCQAAWDAHREAQALRLCLKHFRQRGLLPAFAALSGLSGAALEHPLLARLHAALVQRGDFPAAEQILERAERDGLLAERARELPYAPRWRRVLPAGLTANPALPAADPWPAQRGGHAMVIDPDGRAAYLFGGWDGARDLADFWRLDLDRERWTCLGLNTGRSGGPSPRSCHKMCLDPSRRCIYLMGRFVDADRERERERAGGQAEDLRGDLWRYDIPAARWERVSGDTMAEGGPDLIFDHQMCMDSPTQTLYVFGGRCQGPAAGPPSSEPRYSGLFAYHVSTRRWRLLRDDAHPPHPSDAGAPLRSRIGHSMLLDPRARELWVFAGQRGKEYLSDLYRYSIEHDRATEVARDYAKTGGPDAGFTQRATLDADLGEFYVLSGLTREKNTAQETVKNAFWTYSVARDRWTKVYQNEAGPGEYWGARAGEEPVPRFAHQMVYDQRARRHLVFGGNPGEQGNAGARLDDLWELRLERAGTGELLRRARFEVRARRFREMCAGLPEGDAVAALRYLREDVAACVDHADEAEGREFRELAGCLFGCGTGGAGGAAGGMVTADAGDKGKESADAPHPGAEPFRSRTELYERLAELFPRSMREPDENLVDLVPVW